MPDRMAGGDRDSLVNNTRPPAHGMDCEKGVDGTSEGPALNVGYLQLLSDTLEAGLAESPRKRRQPRGDAPTGPLWDVEVPNSKEAVAHIIEFARRGGRLEFTLNGLPFASGEIQSIRAERSVVIVTYTKSFLTGEETTETAHVPFPGGENSNIAKLCRGEVVAYRSCTAQLKDTDISFYAAFENGAAKISWDCFELTRPGIFGRRKYTVKHILIGPDSGRIVLGSKFWTWVLPDFTWKPMARAAALILALLLTLPVDASAGDRRRNHHADSSVRVARFNKQAAKWAAKPMIQQKRNEGGRPFGKGVLYGGIGVFKIGTALSRLKFFGGLL